MNRPKFTGRRKVQIQYFVQDWSDNPRFWWSNKRWSKEIKSSARSMKKCKNIKIAIKYARKLQILGGNPLISRRILRKKSYWEDFTLHTKIGKYNE